MQVTARATLTGYVIGVILGAMLLLARACSPVSPLTRTPGGPQTPVLYGTRGIVQGRSTSAPGEGGTLLILQGFPSFFFLSRTRQEKGGATTEQDDFGTRA